MVTEPAVEGAVYVVRHELVLELVEERVHVLGLNEPPPPPSLHLMVPEGVVGELLVSVTVAVSVIEPPVNTDAGFGDTVVVVPQFKTAAKEPSLVIDIVLRLFVPPLSDQYAKLQEP